MPGHANASTQFDTVAETIQHGTGVRQGASQNAMPNGFQLLDAVIAHETGMNSHLHLTFSDGLVKEAIAEDGT
ncbi:MAG: hypothetical protein GX087_02445 [Desulfobulbaceae bacterium]|nr:hypothetical protein [Desulfobulbaceae bacterium]